MVLETQVVATNVFSAPVLAKYRLMYQAFPRDLWIQRNMASTGWVDSFASIAANNILVSMETDGKNIAPEEIMAAFEAIKDPALQSAATRYAIVAGLDNKMWLEHQTLPGSAEAFTAKPTYCG